MKSISQVTPYMEDTEKRATSWVGKISSTLKQIMFRSAETVALVLVPQIDSETAIVLLNKRAVTEYSPEVSLETPSLMFSCDDVEQTRESPTRPGVVVGDIAQVGNVLTYNFRDPEGHYFAFSKPRQYQRTTIIDSRLLGDYEKERLQDCSQYSGGTLKKS